MVDIEIKEIINKLNRTIDNQLEEMKQASYDQGHDDAIALIVEPTEQEYIEREYEAYLAGLDDCKRDVYRHGYEED